MVAACAVVWNSASWLLARDRPSALSPAEKITLKDRRSYEGLIESEDDQQLNLIQVQRVDRRLHLMIRPIQRAQVLSIERVSNDDRSRLLKQIEQFRNRTAVEAGRMDDVRLGSREVDGVSRRTYDGHWFALESTLDEPTTRQIVVRLEQMFTVYRQVLPRREEPSRRLTLAIYGTTSAYRDELRRLGVSIERAACFVPDANRVLAGSDVNRASAQLQDLKRLNAKLQDQLHALERQLQTRLAELAKRMNGEGVNPDDVAKTLAKTRQGLEKEIADKRSEIQRVNRQNQELFERACGQMFSQLYHEAFHAYLENYVYPRRRHNLPLWLNEGMAQLFESALPQSTSLRVDVPDEKMLKRLKADLAGRPLPLLRVIEADQDAFLSSPDAARLYLYAWGLAYYLAFDQGVVPSEALDGYVAADAKRSARHRFEHFVGCSLDKFEQRWREDMLKWR